jgi:hypothetical protein
MIARHNYIIHGSKIVTTKHKYTQVAVGCCAEKLLLRALPQQKIAQQRTGVFDPGALQNISATETATHPLQNSNGRLLR